MLKWLVIYVKKCLLKNVEKQETNFWFIIFIKILLSTIKKRLEEEMHYNIDITVMAANA